MNPSATLPYIDSDNVISYLRTVFSNPNRKAEAYTAYHKLKMKPKDDYADFLAEFMQLAEEAGVVVENRKRDLYSKLPYLLQSQVIWALHSEAVPFETFTLTCQSMSHEINIQIEAKSGSGTRARTSGAGGGTTSAPSQTPSIRMKREGSTQLTTLTTDERQTLIREGRCFSYRE
jgi:hypothetical protein